jgi:hypothetical protein
VQLAPGVMGATLNVFALQSVQTLFVVAVQVVEDVPDGHTAQSVHGADPLTLKVEPAMHAWPRASGSAAASSSTHASREVEVIVLSLSLSAAVKGRLLGDSVENSCSFFV